MSMFRLAGGAFACLIMAMNAAAEGLEQQATASSFIADMVRKHHFVQGDLESVFRQVDLQPAILERIAKPAEAMPWHAYRKIFMTETRIQNGLAFWREHTHVLAMAQDRYGVPPEIIVAILGVETGYGERTGGYRVIDALSTLAFEYPKRAEFFRKELEEFLLLCREEGRDPLAPKGSYAGAMGLPQFMPSSFRHFAIDFDGDNYRDIWRDANDSIASIANYFAANGWRRGELVAVPTEVRGTGFRQLLDGDLKPHQSMAQLQAGGVRVPAELEQGAQAKLVALEQPEGYDYWLGLHNFYVITRYNHSPLYAMAVHELGQAIKARL